MIIESILIIPADEQRRRISKIRELMAANAIDSALISSNTNIYYLTGRVFSGYILLQVDKPDPIYLVKRPVQLSGNNVVYIHKPENIPAEVAKIGITDLGTTALELNALTYNSAMRLTKAIEVESTKDISSILSTVRAVKTPYEINLIRQSGIRHTVVYQHIPALYRPGMTDLEFQVEIERASRLDGCLGQFRIAGDDMELYMGNILAGDNADAPSPYDFAMGGAGIDPSLPVGANGTIIKRGMSVMVDMNGNYTGYMTDMTRCFEVGVLSPKAVYAHQLSIDICHALAEMGEPGVEAKSMYDKAYEMAKQAGYEEYFMGHRQHAGFVGHGIGIEVNEMPVLSPRSRNILETGNVIAIEPKFVIPGTGAVGIENTYVVNEIGPMECLTKAPEQLIQLD